MSPEHKTLVLAKSVLMDCPEFLSQRMIDALERAGVPLPPDVREKFQITTEPAQIRAPMKDP